MPASTPPGHLAAALLGAALVGSLQHAAAQEPADPGVPAVNPFAGIATHRLTNGLRLWIADLEGAPDVSVGVLVPYGWDQDPAGREELAHFTEHMLFGDHAGRTEQAILDEVQSRGGRRNGITTPDHTFYYVTTPAEHGLFGVDWLGRVLEPKAMDPAVVERNRQPVALEIGARPRELLDHLVALWRTEWLRPPEYWEREFGLDTRAARVYDRYAALQRITPDDLRAFYDRYYTPEAMTVIVAGDVDPAAVLERVTAAFGALEARPVPPRYGPLTDPGRPFRNVTWSVRPNVLYQRVFKVYEATAADHLRLHFLARYLDRRLGMRLRFGPVKAVYGVSAQVVRRGPATHLLLSAPVDPAEWDYAMEVVEDELAALAGATAPPDRFAADRAAVVQGVVATNRNAQDLVFWAHDVFDDPALHPDFPDVAAAFAAVEPRDLADLVGRMGPERQGTWIARPQPLSQGVLLAGVLFLSWLTVRLTARVLTSPVDMRRIRYVARIRMSPPALLLHGSVHVGAGLVLLRLVAAAGERAAYGWILPVDSWLFQTTVFALAGMALLALGIAWLSLPPRKLLLFEDHLRLKYLAFRSRRLPFDTTEVRAASWADVLRSPRPWRTVPLTLGLGGQGVWIRPAHGPAWLVRVRRPLELLHAVRAAAGSVEGRAEDPVELAEAVGLVP